MSNTPIDPNAKKFPVNLLGSATLDETCRSIRTVQQEETANLESIEPVKNDPTTGDMVKVNIFIYERADSILDVLDDVRCFDVSTAQGASAAAAAQQTHRPVFSGDIWVEDNLTPVEILGRTSEE